MKIIYMGTPEFAVPSLQALINSKHQVVAVVTQPDKPAGRSKQLIPTPVKQLAVANGIEVFQFNKIRQEGVEIINNIDADIIVTCAYGQILNSDILFAKKYGVINVHGSILPKYRGASPIQSAIIDGESETGITILKSDIGIDDGDIIHINRTNILENETYGQLADRLSELGAKTLIEALDLIESGRAQYVPQDNNLATHCSMFSADFGKLNFNNNAQNIVNLVNGINPSPVAFMYIDGKRFRVYNAHKLQDFSTTNFAKDFDKYVNGEVMIAKSKLGLMIKANDGVVVIDTIQADGGKVLSAKDFLNGGRIVEGDIVDNE